MTIFKELLLKNRWEDVISSTLATYSDQELSVSKYRTVWETLENLEPTESQVHIVLERKLDVSDGLPYVDVYGSVENDPQAVPRSLEFHPWEEWLGMKIHADTLARFSEIEILAHCLWEMTWHGFSQTEIQGARQSLLDQQRSR